MSFSLQLKPHFRLLEDNLEMIKVEFAEMEKYWRNKLTSEREFYEEHIQLSDARFQELQHQIQGLIKHLEEDINKTGENEFGYLPTILE